MATQVKLPKFSQTIQEGAIVAYLVKVGDKVKKGDYIFEIEVDSFLINAMILGASLSD